jgi:hypothetical protein
MSCAEPGTAIIRRIVLFCAGRPTCPGRAERVERANHGVEVKTLPIVMSPEEISPFEAGTPSAASGR